MVFKITSQRAARDCGSRHQSAFTLAETLLSIGITSIISIALACTFIYGVKSIAALNNYIALDRGGRRALDTIMADVRGCWEVSSITGTYDNASMVKFMYFDTNGVPHFLTYQFNSTARTLTRQVDSGTATAVLTQCTGHFELFQPKLQAGTWNQYQNPASLSDCKVVLVKWTGTRTLLNSINNTEDIVTAKVLMRN